MEWAAVLRDIAVGLLIAGAAAAWVPDSFWQSLFFVDHPLQRRSGARSSTRWSLSLPSCARSGRSRWPPFWNGGTSSGGVISFIFADLIIVPVIIIYARYYGRRVAMFSPPATLYATMVTAGYFIELLFAPLHMIPSGPRHAAVGEAGVRWNYTTWLNIIFLVLAAALVLRFLSTGGRQMLAMMGGGPTT